MSINLCRRNPFGEIAWPDPELPELPTQVAVLIFWAEFSSRLKQQNCKKEEDDADNGEFTSKEKDLR